MSENKAPQAPQYGLVHDFPGAPSVPHSVVGFEGEFEPGEPRPLEECLFSPEDGSPAREISFEEAKEINDAEGFPLALVRKGGSGGWKRVPQRNTKEG